MDVTQAHVVKCKSSNSGKTVKSEHRNKKSRSNAEIPPYVMKKRGVYVGATRLRPSEPEKNQVQEKPKAPPRPRAGNKKFLASVLTILSKSTTGTQYPDNDDACAIKTGKRNNRLIRKKVANVEDVIETKTTKKREENENKAVKKPKYRSKVLNNEVDKEMKQEQFVVLKPQKEIITTPSIYSENDSFNWSYLPSLAKKAQQSKEVINDNIEYVASELVKEIMEGRKPKKERRVRIDEPTTLVAETPQKDAKLNEVTETNGKLYDFFLDLLETTISKNENDKINLRSEGSSPKFEIDETVAKKLNEPRENPPKAEAVTSQENNYYCLKDLEMINRTQNPKMNYQKEMLAKTTRTRKVKNESFSFIRKPPPKNLKADSVIETKKSFSRKQKKQTLINLFKEQLSMDEYAFEEPQNLFQALKVIAQNKKKCQKTIHFEKSLKKRKDYGIPDCMIKRRNIISSSTKSSCKKQLPARKMSEISGYRRPRSEFTTDFEESCHSLEVVGYDYETPSFRKGKTTVPKDLLFTYHSTPSYSERSLESKDVLDFSETDSMYFF